MHTDAQASLEARRAAAARHGRGLLVLGLLALLRLGCRADGEVSALELGRPLSLELPALSGEGFRLLPGVGPTLAARLEQARRAAGGVLGEPQAREVRGVGPRLLERWRRAAGSAPVSASGSGTGTGPEPGPAAGVAPARRPP